MNFDEPIPFEEAIAIAERKGLLPTTLSSAQLSELKAQLKQRAVFSARMNSAEVLAELQKNLEQLASQMRGERGVYMGIPEAKAQLREAMVAAGVRIAPVGTRPILDFYSDARRDLMVRTTLLDTLGFGRHVSMQSEGFLFSIPALELVRIREPKTGPRDWPERWAAAMDDIGSDADSGCTDPDEAGGRMVALQNHPIWQALGDGAGGYSDTLGNSWPPFAFNSGMSTAPVGRDDAIALGILGVDEEVEPDRDFDMNENLEASVAKFDAALQEAISGGGLKIVKGVLKIANARRAQRNLLVRARLSGLARICNAFNPDEPRDAHGKWIEGQAADWSKEWAAGARSSGHRDFKHALMKHLEEKAKENGWRWGWKQDPAAKGRFTWVKYFDTPAGQISFHAATPDFKDLSSAIEKSRGILQEKIAAYKEEGAPILGDLNRKIELPEMEEVRAPRQFSNGTEERNFYKGKTLLEKDFSASELYRPSNSVRRFLEGKDAAHFYEGTERYQALKDEYGKAQDRLNLAHSFPEYHAMKKVEAGLANLKAAEIPSQKYTGQWDKVVGAQAERLQKLFAGTGEANLPGVAESRPMGNRSLAVAKRNILSNSGYGNHFFNYQATKLRGQVRSQMKFGNEGGGRERLRLLLGKLQEAA